MTEYNAKYFAELSKQNSVVNTEKYFLDQIMPRIKSAPEKGEWSIYHPLNNTEKYNTNYAQVFKHLSKKGFKITDCSDQRERATNYLITWVDSV